MSFNLFLISLLFFHSMANAAQQDPEANIITLQPESSDVSQILFPITSQAAKSAKKIMNSYQTHIDKDPADKTTDCLRKSCYLCVLLPLGVIAVKAAAVVDIAKLPFRTIQYLTKKEPTHTEENSLLKREE